MKVTDLGDVDLAVKNLGGLLVLRLELLAVAYNSGTEAKTELTLQPHADKTSQTTILTTTDDNKGNRLPHHGA